MAILRIDYSTLALWRLCPQKFIYSSKRNFAEGSTVAQDFGTLLHFGTELIGKSGIRELPPMSAIDNEIGYLTADGIGNNTGIPLPNETDDLFLKILHYTALEAAKTSVAPILPDERRSLKHALTLIARYAENYVPDTLELTHYEQEHEMLLGTTKAGDTVYYRGTLDGILPGAVLERKTTGWLNSNFLELPNPNDQATGYVALARNLTGDANISRVIFDGISTEGYGKDFKSKTADPSRWSIYTNPAKLFLRTETTRSEDQIESWKTRVLRDCGRLIEDYYAATVAMNAPQACNAYNTKCAFKHLCMAPASLRTTLEANAVKRTPWKGFSIEERYTEL